MYVGAADGMFETVGKRDGLGVTDGNGVGNNDGSGSGSTIVKFPRAYGLPQDGQEEQYPALEDLYEPDATDAPVS